MKMKKASISSLKMPGSKKKYSDEEYDKDMMDLEEDEDLEMYDDEYSDEDMMADDEGVDSPLLDFSDDDLIAELESRGLLEAEDMEDSEYSEEDEEEMDYEEEDEDELI